MVKLLSCVTGACCQKHDPLSFSPAQNGLFLALPSAALTTCSRPYRELLECVKETYRRPFLLFTGFSALASVSLTARSRRRDFSS